MVVFFKQNTAIIFCKIAMKTIEINVFNALKCYS